jgi:hypothetical protein
LREKGKGGRKGTIFYDDIDLDTFTFPLTLQMSGLQSHHCRKFYSISSL